MVDVKFQEVLSDLRDRILLAILSFSRRDVRALKLDLFGSFAARNGRRRRRRAHRRRIVKSRAIGQARSKVGMCRMSSRCPPRDPAGEMCRTVARSAFGRRSE